MKRLGRIFWAHIQCNLYLLHPKHFLKEQSWTFSNAQNKTTLVVAVKGSPALVSKGGKYVLDFGECELMKIFYCDPPLKHPTEE